MSEGEATTRVDVDRRDELGALARAFNEMAGRVHERDAALRAEKASLERRVAERTAELARFASMAEASGDFFGFADLDERIVYVNPAGRRMLGLAADAPLDRLRIGDVHPDAAYTQLREALIPQALKDGSCAGETELRHLDGHEIPVSIMLAIPRAADGSPLFVSAIMHDITARRQAEARIAESERQLRDSEARFRTVFHNSPALQSLLRAEDSVLVEVNQTFLATLGFQRDEVIGRSPFELAAAEDPSALVAYREKLLAQGHIQHHELALRRCDGRRIRVLLSTYPVTINGTPHFVSAGVDITRQKEAEAELQHALATERELNQLRTQFVSLVSHEFRTPLEIIMSSADNLRRYHERLPPEKRERLLVTISRSVRRMSDMMEEVLVLGRLEANRMTFDPVPVDLPSLCRRICDEIDSATGARCVIELRTEGVPDMAHADESLLRHIFGNLLSNAVKYSPQQERVDFLVEREGADAVCRITDRGRGIPAADQKRLFQAFQRGGNVGQIPGTGLGLLIVQRCVALHGGGIQFESAEGQGTTFIVRLPLFPQDPSPT